MARVVGPARHRSSARALHAPGLLAAGLLALGALACAGSPAAPEASRAAASAVAPAAPEGAAPDAPGRRVLLFPLNVVGVPLPSEVESGSDAVASELRAYLERRGFAGETLELGAAREAWLRAAMAHKEQAGAEKMSLEGAASVLARQLAETHAFEALLLPWIAMRAAELEGRDVEWDGVERKLDLGKARRARWVLGRLELWVKAPSIQVLGFAPSGEKLFEGIGGLDLVEKAEIEVSTSKLNLDMVPMPRIFENRAHLAEGIGLALAPFVPPDEAGKR